MTDEPISPEQLEALVDALAHTDIEDLPPDITAELVAVMKRVIERSGHTATGYEDSLGWLVDKRRRELEQEP